MNLITSEKSPTICLNMIVKNESHIIKNTLEKLCNKIKFDYWVICDTGSTDNTPQIITDFFQKKSIKGELFYDEWVNFSHNRTLALQRAYKKTQLLLIFDADDEIVGNIQMPTNVLFDEYHLKFGSSSGVSYTRVLLINNHKRFQYLSVLHEFINCKEGPTTSTTIDGNYYVISGRTGNRSLDPNKYLKDALILEKAYEEALNNNDHLFHRYAFYCANSYKDCGKYEDAIKWYKITLSHEKQWPQEKYVSCLYIFDCLNALNRKEEGFFYLVKSFEFDKERVECLYPLLVHYCCENLNHVAYNYYLFVKDFYENHYLTTNITNKLFVSTDKFDFFVPYYMILIADKVQDFKCVIKMYEIVFIKKHRMFDDWYIKNFLYNLQFFLNHISDSNLSNFIRLANDYIQFLNDNGVQIQNYDFVLKDVYKNAGINFEKYIINPVFSKPQNFSKQQCSQSKNILIYTGFSDINWNYTYTLNNALGGSEKAVAYLSKCFPKDYTIYISGHVENETIDNIHYIHLDELTNLINSIPFHTVIVSRYISFYDMFPTCSFYQSFIWAHDNLLLPYGSNLNDIQLLKKWENYINGCICLTEWHHNLFLERYPILKNKITIINNGIDLDSFPSITNNYKIKNRFIYTSRPERGLNNLLNLWPQILEKIPDATLTISCYVTFPSNQDGKLLKNIIDANPNTIRYLGKLNTEKLYEEMSKAEFWLYPTHWSETSCITALEMLMSEVICLYYPVAGLTNTMDKYGIQVCSGKEIETIVSLSESQKEELRENGREYAQSFSWFNRYNNWSKLLLLNKNTVETTTILKKEEILFILPNWYNPFPLEDYFDSLKNIYNINIIKQGEELTNFKIDQAIFVCILSDNKIYSLLKKYNIEISILNTEPLNNNFRLINFYQSIPSELDKNVKIYDYSLSNLQILNNDGYLNTHHLPYKIYETENTLLKNLYKNTPKEYDFGIISYENPIILERRKNVVNYLISQKYSVNIIQGWKEIRDKELAKCSIILNIHGQWAGQDSLIFEHIRCDRLLEAGFKILSEESLYLDEQFIKKYPNLMLNPFNDFFNVDFYLKLNWLKNDDKSIKIIDCFTFYNELNMLNYRLNVLNDVVDYFILIEANQTHVGKPKKLFFDENKPMFEKFIHKIIHIVVELPFNENIIDITKGQQWTNEKHQRNCINEGIDMIKEKLNDNDCIIISDVDEIPDPKILLQIKNNSINNDINVLEQDFYYYNLNSKRNEYWYHSKTISYKKYKELNLPVNDIRFCNGTIIKNGGWHLSNFGDADFIKNKLENFAHQEYNSDNFTNIEKLQKRIDSCSDLFGRYGSEMNYIEIEDNNYLPPMYSHLLKNFYKYPNKYKEINYTENYKEDNFYEDMYNEDNYIKKDLSKNKITIGFHSNQLCERGTEVALYDYAYYNQKLYENKSIIFYCINSSNNDQNVIKKFEKEFKCYAYNNFSEIDQIILDEKIDYLYNQKSGSKSDNQLVTNCPNLIHAVFNVDPHGEKYATISKQLSSKYNNIVDYIPHMINLPSCSDNIRSKLNIPSDAIVIGRIGGFYQFDIEMAHRAIRKIVELDSKIIFLLVNTNKFYEHPRIIYLNRIIDPIEKVKFINSCDAMIHARSDGETFGLAVAEFSSLNKPVITCVSKIDNCHIEILSEKAIIYDSEESLINIFKNIRTIIKSRDDWNAYKEFTPEKVMEKFYTVFDLPSNIKHIRFDNFLISCYKNDNLATGSICKNEKWEPHILNFLNYYKKCIKINTIVDIGAHIGYHTLYFSEIVKENEGYVYAFEPQPQNYYLLNKNINNNNLKNVIPYDYACSDCECESKIAIASLNESINMGDFTLNHNINDNKY